MVLLQFSPRRFRTLRRTRRRIAEFRRLVAPLRELRGCFCNLPRVRIHPAADFHPLRGRQLGDGGFDLGGRAHRRKMPDRRAIGNHPIILRNADSKGRALSGGRVHAPPHWLQAVPPLTMKLSFPAQKRRCEVINTEAKVKRQQGFRTSAGMLLRRNSRDEGWANDVRLHLIANYSTETH